VPSDFLPPDPYAETRQPTPGGDGNRAVIALAAGVAALGLLAFTAGMLFFVTLPASIAGWVLGNRAKQAGTRVDQANVAVIMGIVGTIAGVVATIVWVLVWTRTS
jgi:hypothetical protein